jgi:hypothetical protein
LASRLAVWPGGQLIARLVGWEAGWRVGWSASWLFARMCRRTPGSAGFEGVAGCPRGWHGVALRAAPSARGGRHAVPLASAAEGLGQERAGQARVNSPSGEGRQGSAQEGEPAKRHRYRSASARAGKQASRQAGKQASRQHASRTAGAPATGQSGGQTGNPEGSRSSPQAARQTATQVGLGAREGAIMRASAQAGQQAASCAVRHRGKRARAQAGRQATFQQAIGPRSRPAPSPAREQSGLSRKRSSPRQASRVGWPGSQPGHQRAASDAGGQLHDCMGESRDRGRLGDARRTWRGQLAWSRIPWSIRATL